MPAPVLSVFGRIGAVVAAAGDYAAILITNDSSVAGAFVKDALNTLATSIAAVGAACAPVRQTIKNETASRSLIAGDNNAILEANSGSAIAFTVDGGVNAAGDVVCFAHRGAGAVSFVQGGGGMTLTSEGGLLNSKGTGACLAIWFATSTRAYLLGNRA